MKKIFVALVLALALCLSLVGCGEEKSGADYVIEAFENIGQALETTPSAEGVHISFSVAELTSSSLCTWLGVDQDSAPELTDGFLEIYGKAGIAMVNLGVALDDKALNLAAHSDGEKVIWTSEQLSQNYGCTVAEFYAMAEKLSGGELSFNYEDLSKYNDPAAMAAMNARYGEKLEALVRENFEFTTEKDGKNVLVSFALTPENVAAIAYELVTYVQADTEMMDMIGKMYGEEITSEISALELNKDDMLSELTEAGFSGNATLTITKKDSKLVAADVTLNADETPVTMQYAETENGFTANVKAQDVVVDVVSKSGNGTYAFTVKATEADETVFDLALDVADDITLEVTVEDITIGATVEYTATEKGFEATLTEVKAAGVSMDVSDMGLKLLVETGVEAPALPEEYTSIANYTEQEFQTILFEFIVNAGLLSYMMQ